MTLVAIVAIIALAAGGLIVVMLAIAHAEPLDDDEPPVPSARRTPEPATARAQKPPRHHTRHGFTQMWGSWRARRRRRSRRYLP